MEKGASREARVGGIPFFASLATLIVVLPVNASILLAVQQRSSLASWTRFGLGALTGALIALFLIRGHLSVFFHELKHSILSNLAGNKAKGFRVRSRSGHFEYSYTKDTAAYNAFISLAPYMMPLFTAIALAIGLLLYPSDHLTACVIAGIGAGVDAVLNFRDVHPAQSDIYLIRGGYGVGLFYILAMNLTNATILAIWVSRDITGIKAMLYCWWWIALKLSGNG